MKHYSQKLSLRFRLGTAGVAFLFLAICQQNAEAQTNTFPTTGNAGVGTTTPSAALQINSSTPGVAAVKVKGAPSQTANLLEFRSSDDTLRSYVNPSGALFFNPAMDQVPSALTIAPNFNGAYYAGAEHNAFTINGANMAHYGLYTNPTVRMFLIKDVNGYNAFEVNKIGMATLRGDMSNRSWVTNIHVDSANAYYAGNADGLLINGTGLASHGLYSGGTVRMLRVVGTGEALAVTRENRTGFGTLTPAARVEIIGSGSTSASVGLSVKNSAASSLLHVRDDGYVGIGTAGPGFRFDVQGGQINSSGGLCIAGDCKTAWSQVGGGGGSGTITGVTAGSGLTGGGTTGSVTLNVGAGTGITVAADTVSVNYGSTAGTAVEGNKSITVSAGSGMSGGGALTLGSGGTVTLTNTDKGSSQNIFKNVANSAGTTQFSAGSNSDAIRFAGSGGTSVTFDAATHKITIDGSTSTISAANISAGQFGQNTGGGNYTFPGNVTVNGNIAAKYQDLAEWVPSSQQLAAGTVVVLDTTKSNQVISSGTAYDTRVAGVISAQPGITLGEGGEGKVLVATTGRVRVKVDASRGPIQIGDLLVTSDVSGVAMKSEAVEFAGRKMHMPGTIIGKALEPLAKGSGEILVLLSLQ